MKPGCAEKQCFKFRQIVFRACLGCFQSTQNWIELGTWNIVLPFIIWWKLSPAQLLPPGFELAIFKPEDWHSNHCATGPLPVENSYCTLSLSLSLHSPCEPQRQFFRFWFFFTFPLKNETHFFLGDCRGQARQCKKTFFSRPEKLFFSALPLSALVKLIDARLYKKKGSEKLCFCMPLVKSANSTSLPRLSLLQKCADAYNT